MATCALDKAGKTRSNFCKTIRKSPKKSNTKSASKPVCCPVTRPQKRPTRWRKRKTVVESELGRAQARAVRLLTMRSRSEAELKQRLAQAGFDENIVDETVAWCRRIGYVDDARFAAEWVEYRMLHSPSGRRRLVQELRQKGVADNIIEAALDEWLPPETERQLCLEAAQGRFRRLTQLAPDVRRRRLSAFLQRRGFGYDDIRYALSKVDTLSDKE